MASPIFFDMTGRRRRLVGRLSALLLLVLVAGAVLFAGTIIKVPAASPLEFGHEREQPLPFRTHLARLRHRLPKAERMASDGHPVHVGFYVPWDDESYASLNAHYDELNWVVAANGFIDRRSGVLKVQNDSRLRALVHNRLHRPKLLLMVQNVSEGHWFGREVGALLRNRSARQRLIDASIATLHRENWQGAVFDIENIDASLLSTYRAFLAEAHGRFQKEGLSLALTVPAGEAAWNLRRFGAAVDYLYLMDYDQHWQGGEAGPIASQDWFAAQLANARVSVPARKLIVAVGNYGYDWHDGVADALTVSEAWLKAHDSGARPVFDPASGNSGFAWDEGAHKHSVWMMDAATTWNQLDLLRGVGGVAIWRLGGEDPGFWEDLAAWEAGRQPRLGRIPPPTGTDVEGSGEILRIDAQPRGGDRTVTFAPDHSIIGERFGGLPTPYVVRRIGAENPKNIALTFDDGPDPDYTPKILSVLEREHVPATFFIIGENAMEHPEIVRRIDRDGDEIGNHSYTHPNLAEESPLGTMLELNATQRLIEAYTGRSTRLFRAPYFGDAEPTTADELGPAKLAQDRGYTNVGLHVDPADWRAPGVKAIVARTLAQIRAATAQRSANIILLHDGGGVREQTVVALPLIINGLRAAGYHFVTVSQLAGLSRNAAMPPVQGTDLLSVRADVGFFILLALLGYAIR